MDGKPTRIEQMNQAVRGLITLALRFCFCWGFVVTGKISGEVFTAVFTGIVGFWFGIRGAPSPPPVAAANGGPKA